ncbi:hypothetical protein Lesp02_59850 [Lentzea sp. NBRC 105346]|nr:hypothetical protein Lesp02_59850 [Lentzea sp. NBRC 105346]
MCASHLVTLPTAPHGPVRAAIDVVRKAADEFDPDLVVIFGTDHRRAFREVVPTFSVVLSASAQGDVQGPSGSYDVPSEVGRELAADLIAHDFDIAIGYRVALDHAFGHTARDLLGSIDASPCCRCSSTAPARPWRRSAGRPRWGAGSGSSSPHATSACSMSARAAWRTTCRGSASRKPVWC